MPSWSWRKKRRAGAVERRRQASECGRRGAASQGESVKQQTKMALCESRKKTVSTKRGSERLPLYVQLYLCNQSHNRGNSLCLGALCHGAYIGIAIPVKCAHGIRQNIRRQLGLLFDNAVALRFVGARI